MLGHFQMCQQKFDRARRDVLLTFAQDTARHGHGFADSLDFFGMFGMVDHVISILEGSIRMFDGAKHWSVILADPRQHITLRRELL